MEITKETFEPLDLVNLITNTLCLVVKFSANWCGPCKSKQFKESYNNLKEKYSDQSNIIKFIELDIDEFEELIASKEYYDLQVESIPYLKITYNGAWAKDFKGTSCIDEIDGILNKITQKYYQTQQENNTKNIQSNIIDDNDNIKTDEN